MSSAQQQISDQQLLAELIRRNGHGKAPWRSIRDASKFREVLIAIGKHDTATIIISTDAIKELELTGAIANTVSEPAGLGFGSAISLLKRGVRVARAGWNGKGMWLAYVSPEAYDVGVKTMTGADDLLPWIGMKTADGKFVPWLASQTDVLAEDWCAVGGVVK